MTYRLNTKKPHIISLILFISFPSVAAVLISPALPVIAQFYEISVNNSQQLITIFLIGYVIGQLVYSPFANRYGRKPASYIGIAIYLVSCMLCLFAIYIQNFEVLLIGRFFMALGSSVGMVVTYTIINDFYHPEQSHSVTSYTVLSYAFMPAVAIAAGGFITSVFTWVDCFYFSLAYGLVILVTVMSLPETLMEKELGALSLNILAKNFKSAFKNSRLVTFSIIGGYMGATVYVIASAGPFIAIETIGLKPVAYSLFLLIPYSAQFLGSLASGWLSGKMPIYKIMTIAFSSMFFGSLFILISFCLNWINTFSLMFPLAFMMFAIPMLISASTVKALSEFPEKAIGASTMSFILMVIAFLTTFFLTILPGNNPLMMPIVFILISILSLISFLHAKSKFKEN